MAWVATKGYVHVTLGAWAAHVVTRHPVYGDEAMAFASLVDFQQCLALCVPHGLGCLSHADAARRTDDDA